MLSDNIIAAAQTVIGRIRHDCIGTMPRRAGQPTASVALGLPLSIVLSAQNAVNDTALKRDTHQIYARARETDGKPCDMHPRHGERDQDTTSGGNRQSHKID